MGAEHEAETQNTETPPAGETPQGDTTEPKAQADTESKPELSAADKVVARVEEWMQHPSLQNVDPAAVAKMLEGDTIEKLSPEAVAVLAALKSAQSKRDAAAAAAAETAKADVSRFTDDRLKQLRSVGALAKQATLQHPKVKEAIEKAEADAAGDGRPVDPDVNPGEYFKREMAKAKVEMLRETFGLLAGVAKEAEETEVKLATEQAEAARKDGVVKLMEQNSDLYAQYEGEEDPAIFDAFGNTTTATAQLQARLAGRKVTPELFTSLTAEIRAVHELQKARNDADTAKAGKVVGRGGGPKLTRPEPDYAKNPDDWLKWVRENPDAR